MIRKKPVDAYGRELWDLYKGNAKFEIVERDDGLVAVGMYGQMYFFGYPKWPAVEQRAVKLARGRVLDIGCGAGRHSIYLQRKGFDVTGIDSSPLAIKVSRLRGLKKAKVLPIERLDRFKPDSFDTVIMLGNNFGLFGSPRKMKRTLKALSRITSAKARIIAETRDPYATKNPDNLEYHAFNRRRGRMAGGLRLRIRHRKIVGPWFDYLMVSRKEMNKLLKGTGWRVEKFLSSDGSQYVAVIGKGR